MHYNLSKQAGCSFLRHFARVWQRCRLWKVVRFKILHNSLLEHAELETVYGQSAERFQKVTQVRQTMSAAG